MPTTVEHIAVEALREIAKGANSLAGPMIAQKALNQIEEMNGPPTVHNLSADDVIIDKPPGGGA
jgi:hypothetical protein